MRWAPAKLVGIEQPPAALIFNYLLSAFYATVSIRSTTVPCLNYDYHQIENRLRMQKITIVTVSHESVAVLPSFLVSAAGHNILVVDNASTDESAALAASEGATVIKNEENLGFGQANNLGVKTATTDWVLLANPDLTFEDGCIDTLLRACERYPDAAIIAPKIIEPSGRVFSPTSSLLANLDGYPHLPTADQDQQVPFVSGACMLLRRDTFLELGGFDENIFLFFEDDDLCRRVCDAGYSIIWIPEAQVHHLRGRSTNSTLSSIYRARYHQSWSRLYVSRKWKIRKLLWPKIFLSAIKLVGAIVLLRKKRIARYAGAVGGYIAFQLGRPAVKRTVI